MKKIFFLLMLLLLIPTVHAESDEDDLCLLTNLAECLPAIVNMPLATLLTFIKALVAEPINIGGIKKIWHISTYILSSLSGLIFAYCGIKLIVSGYNPSTRYQIKELLKDFIIAIILIQSSFFIYSLLLDLSSGLTASILNLVDNEFFLFTLDSFDDIAMEFFYGLSYLSTLSFTALILILRYLIVASGVALFPIGIFLYIFPSLRNYGKAIISFLVINIFMPIFASLVILIGSYLLEISFFESNKMFLMIGTFILADILIFYFLFSALIKSSVSTIFGFQLFSLLRGNNLSFPSSSPSRKELPKGQTTLIKYINQPTKKPLKGQTTLDQFN